MFRKIEHKVVRDPIHGYVNIDYQVVWDCIDTKEFQRLRRIKQLGTAYQVYPTAEHSRFSHSLGVYEIARRMISEVEDIEKAVSEYDIVTVLLAALLHDLGHGPLSHSFEIVSTIDHEKYTQMIILGDSEINKVLREADKELPEKVAAVINHTHPNKLLSQIVSGQLDADRMDYLLRDAYFTGTSYGEFDINRVLRTMRVNNGLIVVKESGIHAVEDYIMARYQMYWQVYYHPSSRSFEALLSGIFTRMKDLKETEYLDDYPLFKSFLNESEPNIVSQYRMDEAACFHMFNQMGESKDPVLRDLSDRLINRKLFTYSDLKDDQQLENTKESLLDQGYDPRYYLYQDNPTQKLYDPYEEDGDTPIWILMKDGSVKELSEVSEIVSAVTYAKKKRDKKIFYPEGVIK